MTPHGHALSHVQPPSLESANPEFAIGQPQPQLQPQPETPQVQEEHRQYQNKENMTNLLPTQGAGSEHIRHARHHTVGGPPSGNGFSIPFLGDATHVSPDTPNVLTTGKGADSPGPFRLPMPMLSPGQLAFTALQFLPVPMLVLNNLKTVVLANDAMGRMLGLTGEGSRDQQDDGSTVSDKLRGQTLSQVGVDMIQDGRPVWISWDSFFAELLDEVGAKHTPESGRNAVPNHGGRNHDTGTAAAPVVPPASDSVVDVVVMSRGADRTTIPSSKSSNYQTSAKMIITIWEIEERQIYYTLTFTNAESSAPHLPGPRISVARTATLDAADRKTIAHSGPPSVCSSQCSASPGHALSPAAVSIASSPFPPMGPPSRLLQSNTPSSLQKMTIIKDALLDTTEMPIVAMWKDGSAPVLNGAARQLFKDANDAEILDGRDLLDKWEVWDDNFTRKYEPSEFPMSVLLREQKPFSGNRIGVVIRGSEAKVVYDILGETIRDEETGDFIAGVITCRDVTHIAQEITQIKEADEERFKLICDTMPQMVWTTAPDGSHDFFNNRWYDYTGLSPEDSMGWGWVNRFHPDDIPESERRWRHSLETGEPYAAENRCLSKEGEWRWMLGRALPFRNKRTGKIDKWFGTWTDVHETMGAKMAAKRTRDELQQVLRHAQTTIFSVDRERKVTMMEGALVMDGEPDSATEESQNDPERFVGQDVNEVFRDLNPQLQHGQLASFLEPMRKQLTDKYPENIIVENYLNDRFYRTRFLPMLEEKHPKNQSVEPEVVGVIGIIMDVSELKAKENDLKEQAKEKRQLVANEAAAKEASRLKSQFLANMSHEIRTPITGVIGMAELLTDLPLENEAREYAENIIRSANALLTVINDILDFSKVESGRLDIEEVQFSLSVVVQDVSKMLSFAAQRKNLSFRADSSRDIEDGLVVLGDPGRVRQIITNLLTNSIKFTASGHVNFSVFKETETSDTIEIKFVVEDTGIGIEEDVLKRLFQPFSQGDPSTARKYGGTGLGLTISKNLLDLMNGKIELKSTTGCGTTATFWIPFHKPQAPQAAALDENGRLPDRLQSEMSVSCRSSELELAIGTPPAEMLKAPTDRLRPPRTGKTSGVSPQSSFEIDDFPMSERSKVHILVVEDNAINQQIATKTIKKLGFNVSAAWNGREALDYLDACREGKSARPSIILMDVQMPVVDGMRCTHILRHHSPYKTYINDVPILAMTASAIQGDREKCRKAGMDDYLAKPVKGKILEKMLVRWCKERRPPPPSRTDSADLSASSCSGSAEQCSSSERPVFGADDTATETPEGPSSSNHEDAPTTSEEQQRPNLNLSLQTPKPLTRNCSHDKNTFPYASQSTRELDSNELAIQLRDDKLMDAADSSIVVKPTTTTTMPILPIPNPTQPEGDELTEANVEKLDKAVPRESYAREVAAGADDEDEGGAALEG